MRSLIKAVQKEGQLERLSAGFTGLLIADDEVAATILESVTAEMRAEGALTWLTYGLECVALCQLVARPGTTS